MKWTAKVRRALSRPRRLWSESYLRLRLTCPVVLPDSDQFRTISVAIPFYGNAKMGHLALFNILSDPRVREIVVLDDGSSPDELGKLRDKLAPFSKKVRLFRRERNWGPFANKIQSVELCTSEWVILLDYDNTLTADYLDSLFKLERWEDDEIYCSAYAYPYFDFRKKLPGDFVDLETASTWLKERALIGPFLNDGNYFLPRERYLETVKPFWKYSVLAADAMFSNYLWLSGGNKLTVLADSWYVHRVHANSAWAKQREHSRRNANIIKRRIRKGASPQSPCLRDDFAVLPDLCWEEPTSISLERTR